MTVCVHVSPCEGQLKIHSLKTDMKGHKMFQKGNKCVCGRFRAADLDGDLKTSVIHSGICLSLKSHLTFPSILLVTLH